MRAIIHSVHSQTPQTIAQLGEELELVVSLDSHLDVFGEGDTSFYPEGLRTIAARTAAHNMIPHASGGSAGTQLVVAIPERMLAAHVADVESQLPPSIRVTDLTRAVRSTVDYLKTAMGIEVYQSPPKSLLNLIGRTKRARSWLLDVDIDFIHEMQGESYTRIVDPEPGVLATLAQVVDFIDKARPETITISEAKVSAIKDPGSRFSDFIARLRDMGYTVEERGIFSSDDEVIRGISVCREFYEEVSKSLMADQMDEMIEGNARRFEDEEKAAAKAFFESKGYQK
ncbi:MAG: hypothetical protein OK456_04475 [Thaumarchaeota archaeon]|nr:hypothetical protein [Nitrososphaerota archaeon]